MPMGSKRSHLEAVVPITIRRKGYEDTICATPGNLPLKGGRLTDHLGLLWSSMLQPTKVMGAENGTNEKAKGWV